MSSEEPIFEAGEYIDPPETQRETQKRLETLSRQRSRSGSASTRESSSFNNNDKSASARRWRVEQVIGTGAFGELYNAWDGERNYAVKFEKPRQDGTSKLLREAELSRMLCENINSTSSNGNSYNRSLVPRFFEYQQTKRGPYMVIELMGRDLSRVRKTIRHHKLSVCSCGFLGKQLISTLEKVHDLGIVHRDIKPQNLVLGNSQENKLDLCLIDFGLARDNFFPQKMNKTNPDKGASFRGTAAYASLGALSSIEQGKRDDLEGAFWVFIDLLWGGLPWRRMSFAKSKERDMTIKAGKADIFEARTDFDRLHGASTNASNTTLQSIISNLNAVASSGTSGGPSGSGTSGNFSSVTGASRGSSYKSGHSWLSTDGVFGGPLDNQRRLITTTGLSGLQLLESLPPCMNKYLEKLQQLQFSARPDYAFFRNCFEELENLGDTPAFRRKFAPNNGYCNCSTSGMVDSKAHKEGCGKNKCTRLEAIAKEIYGKDNHLTHWNTLTKPPTSLTSSTTSTTASTPRSSNNLGLDSTNTNITEFLKLNNKLNSVTNTGYISSLPGGLGGPSAGFAAGQTQNSGVNRKRNRDQHEAGENSADNNKRRKNN